MTKQFIKETVNLKTPNRTARLLTVAASLSGSLFSLDIRLSKKMVHFYLRTMIELYQIFKREMLRTKLISLLAFEFNIMAYVIKLVLLLAH